MVDALDLAEALIEASEGPVFALDTAYRYLAFNRRHADAMLAQYGAKIESGRCLLDYQSVEADREAARRNLDRALRGETFVEQPFSGVEERSRRYFEVAYGPIRGPEDGILGVSVVTRDVTELHQTVLALREGETRYRSLFDSILNGFAYCRMIFENGEPSDFIYLAVNSAFTALTGLKDVVGKAATEVIPGIRESNPELFAVYGRVAATGEPATLETYVEPLGIWFTISVFRPQPSHFVAVFDNITERKQADERLKALNAELEQRVADRTVELQRAYETLAIEEERYHSLFSRMLDGFALSEFLVDDEGQPWDLRFLEVNPAFERLTGLKASQVIGRTAQEVLPLSEPGLIDAIGQVESSGEPAHFVYPFESVGRWFEISAFCPKPGQLAAIFSDVTEQKESEDVIRRLNRDLALRAEELLSANQELESFSYSVSHDLRAPLRHIAGFVQLLREDSAGLDQESRRHLDVITKAATRMSKLIDDLLAFSHVSRAKLNRSPLDMVELVREVIDGLRSETDGRVVTWRIGAMPDTEGDRSLLHVVWSNLVSNALKYTRPRPQAEIEITGEADAEGVTYRIRDNGVGFDMKYASKLFGVFQRLHSLSEFEGTGIGLATVHRIVTRHSGRTGAEGVPGNGAMFWFWLPRARGADR